MFLPTRVKLHEVKGFIIFFPNDVSKGPRTIMPDSLEMPIIDCSFSPKKVDPPGASACDLAWNMELR